MEEEKVKDDSSKKNKKKVENMDYEVVMEIAVGGVSSSFLMRMK